MRSIRATTAATRSRATLLPAAGLVVAIALASFQLAPTGQGTLVTALSAGVLAVVAVVTLAVYRLLVPKVGAATAWAGLVVLWAALVGTFFLLSPDCYTGPLPQRCDPRGVATWAVVGAMLPVLGMITVYLPYRAALLMGRATRFGYRRLRQTAPIPLSESHRDAEKSCGGQRADDIEPEKG